MKISLGHQMIKKDHSQAFQADRIGREVNGAELNRTAPLRFHEAPIMLHEAQSLIVAVMFAASIMLGTGAAGQAARSVQTPLTVQTQAATGAAQTGLTSLGKESIDLTVQVVPQRSVTSAVTVPGNIVAIPHSEYKQHSVLSGRISKLAVSLGDQVAVGQELAQIDSPEINRLAAETLQSRAQLEADIAQSQATLDDEVTQASSKQHLATAHYHRIKTLVSERIAAQKDLEMATSELEITETRLNLAKKKRTLILAALREKLKLTMEPLRHRLKLLGLSEASIEQLLREKRTVVSVPITSSHKGVVTDLAATVGQSVDPSNTLFVVSDLSRVWMRANVYEPDIAKIEKGEQVVATVDSLPNVRFEGTLSFVASEVDPDLRTLGVCAELANRDLKLKPGMYGKVCIQTSIPADSILIPKEAVLQRGSNSYVFVESSAGYERKIITVGRSFGDLVEVVNGLAPGERIVVQGAFQLDGELLKRSIDVETAPSTVPGDAKPAPSAPALRDLLPPLGWLPAFALGVISTLLALLYVRKRHENGKREDKVNSPDFAAGNPGAGKACKKAKRGAPVQERRPFP